MKKLSLLIFLVSVAASAQAAGNNTLSGKWKVHSEIAGTATDQDCTFTQKDTDLSGTCTSEHTVNITGKIDGNKVSWSYDSEYNGTPLTVKFTGTLDLETRIVGSATVDAFGVDGEFTATQSK
jgi:hypothetical protein